MAGSLSSALIYSKKKKAENAVHSGTSDVFGRSNSVKNSLCVNIRKLVDRFCDLYFSKVLGENESSEFKFICWQTLFV